jgi:hypothetical protein
VFEQRRPLHYSYRLASHGSLILRALARSSDNRRRWAALGLSSIGGDLLVGHALRRRTSELYWLRLILDTLDAAAWAAVGKQDATTTRAAVLVAVPHAMEAGYRLGVTNDRSPGAVARALAIPVSSTAGAVLTRRRRRLGTGSTQVLWGAMGVAMTSLLGRHERLERRRAQAAGDEIVAARARAARLQGEAEIALGGAGAPPHDLKKALLILASNGSQIAQGAAQELMDRKQQLAARTASFGTYVGDLLRNVGFEPEDAWSVRLTASQADQLHEEIDRMGPPRVVRLLNEPEARRPGGRVALQLDGRPVDLAADAPPRHWLSDPAPLAFLMSGVWRLTATIPKAGAIPWPIAVLGAAADIVGMLAYRSAPVPANVEAPLTAAFVSSIAYGAAAVRRARSYEDGEGEQIFPAAGAFHGYSLVAARYWDDLGATHRRWVLAGGTALAIAVFLGEPRPIDWAALAKELPFALVPCFAPLGFARREKAKVEMLVSELQATIDRQMDQARADGRAAEIRRSQSYVERAEAALAEIASSLDGADAEAIASMCREARAWLDRAAG